MGASAIAGGNILPLRAVKLSTTPAFQGSVAGTIVQSGAGDRSIGIAQRGTRRSEYVDTSGNAAQLGEECGYFVDGDECTAILGSGGCTVNDLLKAGTLGVLVTASGANDWCCAIALRTGVSGDEVPVRVHIVQRSN